MIRNLDLMLVRAFVAASEAGSVTAAAERLHLTQGAVSQRILRLEDVLGCTLFTRNARGVSLTEEGRDFLLRARRLLEVNDEILSELRSRRPIRRVRLGLPPDLVPRGFEALIESFGAAEPDVEIDLQVAVSPELLRRVEAVELDLALAEGPTDAVWDAVLAVRRLVWLGRADAVERRPLALSFVSSGCAFAPLAAAALERARIPSRAVFESGNYDVTTAAVRAGAAVSVALDGLEPPGMESLSSPDGLPALGELAIGLKRAAGAATSAADALARHIVATGLGLPEPAESPRRSGRRIAIAS